MRRPLPVLTLAAAVLAPVLVGRALLFRPPEVSPPPPTSFEADEATAARHLAEAIRIPTVAHADPEAFDRAFNAAHEAWLPHLNRLRAVGTVTR